MRFFPYQPYHRHLRPRAGPLNAAPAPVSPSEVVKMTAALQKRAKAGAEINEGFGFVEGHIASNMVCIWQ